VGLPRYVLPPRCSLDGLPPARGLIPAYLLPVIDNALGSYVCVAVSGPKWGAVFFWEHELIDYDSDEPTDQGVFFIAPSFEAFLDLIEVNIDAV
jgi:hypothetical protein